MYDFQGDSTITLQHKMTGSGTFTGASLGYAKYTYTNGGASMTVRAKELGTEGNAIRFQLINPGTLTPATRVTTYDKTTTTAYITLKHDGSSVTGTVAEVAAAINAYRGTANEGLPMVAAVTTGGVAAALALTTLSGGLNPSTETSGFPQLTAASGGGGLFYFEQNRPWYLRALSGRFEAGADVAVRAAIVNVDKALNWSYKNEDIRVYSATLTAAGGYEFTVSNDVLGLLMPNQALVVVANVQGTVRVSARVESTRSAI